MDDKTEHVIEYLIDHGNLDEAAAFIRERIVAARTPDEKIWLFLNLANVHFRRGSLQECQRILDVAVSFAVAPDDIDAIASLREEIRERLEKQGRPLSGPEVLESPGQSDPWAGHPDSAADEPRISASFYELDLKQALLDISLDSGVAIVWDRTVEGLVTFEAMDMPLENALSAILEPAGYSYRKMGTMYYVGSVDPQGPAFARISQTAVIPLSSVAADEAVGLLSSSFRRYVQATTKSNNMVCITAPAELMARIRSDLELIDQPPPQVLIEVLVVELRTDYLRAHGIDWLATGDGSDSDFTVGTSLVQSIDAAIGADGSGDVDGVFGTTVGIMAGLRALTADGVADIRASPRLTTLNGRPAQIGISQDQYYVISDASEQAVYSYNRIEAVKATIAVEITPFVGPDDMLTLAVHPQVGDVVGQGEEGLPVIFNRSAKTTIRVKNGETFSIGGLNTTKIMDRNRRIPILGHIPLLGLLFRYEERTEIESEVIIFVTPHVLES